MPNEIGRKHSIVTAEHTLRIAVSALRRGDLRLAVSRGITAVIQASTAALGAPQEIKERADRVVQATRKLIQGVVVRRAAAKLSDLAAFRRPGASRSILPKTASERERAAEEREEREVQEETFGPSIRIMTRGPGILPTYSQASVVRCEEAGSPGGPVFFPADDPYDLWDFFTSRQIRPYDMAICAAGVAVSDRAADRAEWAYEGYKEQLIAREISRTRTFEGLKGILYRPIRLGTLL